MTAKITGVLLIPADKAPLRSHSDLGGEPPTAIKLSGGAWLPSLRARALQGQFGRFGPGERVEFDAKAIALAWKGEQVEAGVAWVSGVFGGVALSGYVRDILDGNMDALKWERLEALRRGVFVYVDNAGQEVQR